MDRNKIKLPNDVVITDAKGNEHRMNIYPMFGGYLFLSTRLAFKFKYEKAVAYLADWMGEHL